ncbi:MAG: TauD/TfdA family dioxygenase [Francisellaceae bacterium]
MEFFTTVLCGQHESSESVAKRVNEALHHFKVVHIIHADRSDNKLEAFYDVLTSQIGLCMDETEDGRSNSKVGGKWLEVRFDPAVENAYRHSNTAQPLHTDFSYVGNSPDFTLMYCKQRAPEGGETVFIDGNKLVDLMYQQAPELLNKLMNAKLLFSKNFTNARDEREAFIISNTNDRRGYKLNWNYFCVDRSIAESRRAIVEDLHDYLNTHILGSDYITAVALNRGEAVIWHDELVLHGRNAFKAEKFGDRNLWKTTIHWKESLA